VVRRSYVAPSALCDLLAVYLGLRPRLVWNGPPALSELPLYTFVETAI